MEILRSWAGMKGYHRSDELPRTLNDGLDRRRLVAYARAQFAAEDSKDELIAEFITTLRTLVDQWIASGKDPNDQAKDRPSDRSYHWTAAEFPVPIVERLSDYSKRHAPRLIFMGSTNVGILLEPHHTYSDGESPLLRAQDRATNEFVTLLDSPNKLRISRCDSCGKYYFKERTPGRDRTTTRGTFCGDKRCRKVASTKRANASLDRAKIEMISWAADAAAKYAGLTKRNGTRTEWILREINRRLDEQGRDRKTPKWVTQNKEAIQEELERRKNAAA